MNEYKIIWTKVYKVEKQIAQKKNCTDQFEKKWKLFETVKTWVYNVKCYNKNVLQYFFLAFCYFIIKIFFKELKVDNGVHDMSKI